MLLCLQGEAQPILWAPGRPITFCYHWDTDWSDLARVPATWAPTGATTAVSWSDSGDSCGDLGSGDLSFGCSKRAHHFLGRGRLLRVPRLTLVSRKPDQP
ncbi:unnamed protein product [Phytophthora fragariaefolia]|uniref:Unnamed protein product n=1 Tax=Phytophthora fragariaefolia TaxID=1490495 RepID=A0A9W6XBP4_9STRA|nr:unnamed protein product [Phytophthora fragariaefolia]